MSKIGFYFFLPPQQWLTSLSFTLKIKLIMRNDVFIPAHQVICQKEFSWQQKAVGQLRGYKLFVFPTQLIERYKKIIMTYRSGLLSSGSSSSTSRSQPYPLCLRNVVAEDSLMNSPPRFSLTSGVVMEPLRSESKKGEKDTPFYVLSKAI